MPKPFSKSLFGSLNFFLQNEYERMFFSQNIVRRIQTARVVASHSTSGEHRRQYQLLLFGKALTYGQSGFAFLRLLLISYLQYRQQPSLTDYLPYDPICVSLVLNFPFFAFPFTVASLSLAVNIFTCLVDYYTTFYAAAGVPGLRLRWLLSTVPPFEVNPQCFDCSLNRLPVPGEWAEQMRSLWRGRSPLLPCGNAPCTSPQLFTNPALKEARLPRLGAQTRTQTTLFAFAIEMGGFLLLTGIVIIFIEDLFFWPKLILGSYSEQQLKQLTRLQRFILTVHVPCEVLTAHYIFYRFLNNLVFLVQSLLLLVFIVLGREGLMSPSPLPPPTVTITISNLFIREHSRLVSTIDHLDRRFAAHLVFAAFITNFPLNAHLIAQMMTADLTKVTTAMQSLLLGASILNHWSCMLYFGLASSAIISCLSSSAPLLQRLQVRLLKDVERGGGGGGGGGQSPNSWQMVFTRLKLAHYYQVVHSTSRRKVGIHFGPVGLVTKRSFVDFLFFYTSVLMYVFKDRN
ncbi:hypothetical protein TYRP_015975 [Tyrophagus putrescentiae]|nr:hypothetical protein TYRP_015975 [Tyrophagus putrescentiae]